MMKRTTDMVSWAFPNTKRNTEAYLSRFPCPNRVPANSERQRILECGGHDAALDYERAQDADESAEAERRAVARGYGTDRPSHPDKSGQGAANWRFTVPAHELEASRYDSVVPTELQ